MQKVVINVYKNDDTFIKSPSLFKFEVEEKDGWRHEVETILSNVITQDRKNYSLSYQYSFNKS